MRSPRDVWLTLNSCWFWPLVFTFILLKTTSSSPGGGGCWRGHTATWDSSKPQRLPAEPLPFAFCPAILLPCTCPNFLSFSSGIINLPVNTPQHEVHLLSVLLLLSFSVEANAHLTEVKLLHVSFPEGWPRKRTTGGSSDPSFYAPCQSSGYGSLRWSVKVSGKMWLFHQELVKIIYKTGLGDTS